MRPNLRRLALLAVLLAPGCGPYALPAPTARPVAASDVVGTWRFRNDATSKAIVVTFRPDGTFTERIVGPRGRAIPCPGGTWSLSGPSVLLDGYVSSEWGPTGPMSWYMIDAIDASGPVLFGGDHPDPDAFTDLSRVATAAGSSPGPAGSPAS